jgi:hypothetical protein
MEDKVTLEIPDQVFKLIMQRFDTLEEQHKTRFDSLESLLKNHVEKDAAYYTTVDRHSTYFAIISLGIAPAVAYFTHKLGWPKIG